MGFDPITASIAKSQAIDAISKSGQVGYITSKKENIYWDGDTTGKETFSGEIFGFSEFTYVRVAEPVKVSTVETVIFGAAAYHPDVFTAVDNEADSLIGLADKPTVVVLHKDLGALRAGTYFGWLDGETYVKSIIGGTKHTIHPIDPKFIPGAVLPVVEIVKEGELSEPSALSEAEAETIEKIVNAGSKYILASVSVGGFPVAVTILRKVIAEEYNAFVGFAGTGSVMIANENGQWAIVVE